MATQSRSPAPPEVDYPTGDGKPVGETPVHRDLLLRTVALIQEWSRADPMVYVSGNMFLYYVEGDNRRHVSPDVFVARGVPDDGRRRDAYFTWVEGKGPDFVIEFTSKSTRREDLVKKFELYRDVLKVREYVLFDPYGEYLKPRLKGYRLAEGRYEPIEPVDGRLPSEVVGLHLGFEGEEIRLVDPATGRPLLWLAERLEIAERERREAIRRAEERAEAEHRIGAEMAEMARRIESERAEMALRAEADRLEKEALRREVEGLRRRQAGG